MKGALPIIHEFICIFKNPVLGMGYHPSICWPGVSQRPLQTIQVVAIALSCPPALDGRPYY